MTLLASYKDFVLPLQHKMKITKSFALVSIKLVSEFWEIIKFTEDTFGKAFVPFFKHVRSFSKVQYFE